MLDRFLLQHLFGRVFYHGHFLKNNIALELQIMIIEAWLEQHVSKPGGEPGNVVVWHESMNCHKFAPGVSIDLAAHALERHCQGGSAEGRRPLKQQVLQQVRKTGLLGPLVTTAVFQP